MKIGGVIKAARTRRGLKQHELADVLKVSTNYISLLENGHRDPSWRFVCDLAEAVRIPLPLLLVQALDDFRPDSNDAALADMATELIRLADVVQIRES